jgi:hypothetical protein
LLFHGRVSGVETGFSFTTGDLTAAAFFAEMGQERTGFSALDEHVTTS